MTKSRGAKDRAMLEYMRATNREAAPRIAHHEAGHAVAQFVFGNGANIEHVSIRTTWGKSGNVQGRATTEDYIVADARAAAEAGGKAEPFVCKAAARLITFLLSGPAAEAKFAGAQWLDGLREVTEDVDREYVFDRSTDFMRAHTAAHSVMRGAAADKFLYRVANWTDELIARPDVWLMVAALASKLNYGDLIRGTTAMRIMGEAWGGGGLPLADLGRRWTLRYLGDYHYRGEM